MRGTVFLLALIVRIAAIELSGANDTTFGDAGDYIMHARSLCVAQSYPERGNLPFFRAPGLPFFIATATACHPANIRAIKYALAFCDALTCALIASLALFWFNRRTAWIAGLGAVFDPLFVAAVCDVRSEPLFMLLLVLSIHELVRDQFARSGVAIALAALTRPTALLCIPLFAMWKPRRCVPFLIAASLTLAPWTIRNYIRYQEIIVVNDAGGFNFWRGSHPEMIALSHQADRTIYLDEAWRFETQTVAANASFVDAIATKPQERSDEWLRRGIANLEAQPALEAKWAAEKALLYWRPWLNPQEYSTKVVVASAAVLSVLYLLAAVGLVRFEDRRAVVVFFVAMWFAHLPYQIFTRLRTPYIDPIAIVLAASAVESALLGPRMSRSRRAFVP